MCSREDPNSFGLVYRMFALSVQDREAAEPTARDSSYVLRGPGTLDDASLNARGRTIAPTAGWRLVSDSECSFVR